MSQSGARYIVHDQTSIYAAKTRLKAISTYLSDIVLQYVKRILILLRPQKKIERRRAESCTLGVAGIDTISMSGSQS